MATQGKVKIYSNDGTTLLFTSTQYYSVTDTMTITETGATLTIETYTYSGSKKFLGLSASVNATEPHYAVGYSGTIGHQSFYIVEGETDKDYLIKGSTLTSIADAIRAKTGGTAEIPVTDMATQIGGIAQVANSPLPIEVSTEEEMTALLTAENVGGVYKYTGTTGTYENGALYVVESNATIISFTITDSQSGNGTFQAEEGMTFYEWVNSDYCATTESGGTQVKAFSCSSETSDVVDISGWHYIATDGTSSGKVKGSTVIVANTTYQCYQD